MKGEKRVRQGHGVLTALLNILPIPHFAYLGKSQIGDIDRKSFWSILSNLSMRL